VRIPLFLGTVLAACLLNAGCGSAYREPLYSQDKDPVGTGETVNGGRNGTWTQRMSGGQVTWSGTYANGRRQGPWKEWNDEGKLLIECSYDQNRMHGEAKIYNWGVYAGTLDRIEFYDHGVKDGEWRYFDMKTGKITQIERYAKGRLQGGQLKVYRDGSLSETVFEKDVPILERSQRGGQLSVYQVDPQKRHQGLWVTVRDGLITSVVGMDRNVVREVLYTFTPIGTPPNQWQTKNEGSWSWTSIVSPRTKYSGGYDPATKEASLTEYDLHQVWTDVDRW
jgi:antitoxin component YwqK of YwqJK toxin-antitoxin module